MFDIYLTEEFVEESQHQAVYGKILLGDYTETFVASLVCWSPRNYEEHWRHALERLITGSDRSALIASYVEPGMSEFLTWWPLYQDLNRIVYVRNELLIYSQLIRPFSSELLWTFIRQRQTMTSEGLPISEWITDIESIRECLARKAKGVRLPLGE